MSCRKATSTNIATGKPYLWLAVHECAHAIAGLVMDEMPPYPGPYLRSVSLIQDGDTLGVCRRQQRLVPEVMSREMLARCEGFNAEMWSNAEQSARYDIVEFIAGPMAELRQRDGSFAPWMCRDQWFEHVRISAGVSVGYDDVTMTKAALDWLAPADPAAELLRLWRASMAILEADWPGIIHMARALRDAVEMDGEEFKEMWRHVRPSPEIRTRRLKRQKMQIMI